ncbi:hypothetical protein Bca4012_085392 [Brassica carinata]|uniref:DUF7769 domain-containing protein n=1 Tax=Brassica carinata TaxID=52824 RepID=A0A8X7SG24_BRACI|nr:hypothetical protein Bca52824_025564 [Brassica carinata]
MKKKKVNLCKTNYPLLYDHIIGDASSSKNSIVIDLNLSPPIEEPEQNVDHLVEDPAPVEADNVIDLNSSPPMEEPEQNVDHLVEDPAPVEADNVIDLNSSPPMEEPEQNVDHLVKYPDIKNIAMTSIASSSKRSAVIDLNSSPPMEEPNTDVLEQNVVDHLVENPAPVEADNANRSRKGKLNLTFRKKELIFNALWERSLYGKLERNAAKEVSEMFSIHARTAYRVWKQAKEHPGDYIHMCKKL